MTNRRIEMPFLLIPTMFMVAAIGFTACGDDDTTVGNSRSYNYNAEEFRYESSVYRCINNLDNGAMWCENLTRGEN